MKRRILSFVIAFVVLALLAVFVTEVRNMVLDIGDATSGDAVMNAGSGYAYSYGDVELLVSYLADTEDEVKSLARLVDPLAKSREINVQYIRQVFDVIDAPGELYAETLVGMQDTDTVSAEQFDEIYDRLVSTGVTQGLSRMDIYIFATYTDADEAVSYVTDGEQTYELATDLADEYIDHIADVYVKNNNIFKINGYADSSVVLDNVWIEKAGGGSCTYLYKGVVKESACAADVGDDCVASLTLDNSGVTAALKYEDERTVRVESVSDGYICLDDRSRVPCAENFTIYNVYDEPICETSSNILTGYRKINIVMDGTTAVAAVIDDELISCDIRVILSNDDYTSYDMKRADISGDTGYTVTYPDDSQVTYEAGERVCIEAEDYESGSIFRISADEHRGHLQVNTLSRSYGIPVYSGDLEVRICDEGVLNIINEVPLEQYLYSVVASEMPLQSHEEALKAMAICARGYAYSHIDDEAFEEYHADLDDSSLCQVYNNVYETEESINAVKATYGMVPVYEGNVIVPFYFSTSGGMTCTNSDIWGGSDYGYLESNLETVNRDKKDLSNEDDFRQFISDSMGYDIIDKDMPYYRWRVEFTTEEITEAINSMLEERVDMSSDNIRVRNEKGQFVSQEITDIGDVLSVTVTERSESGVVTALEIEGTDAVIQVAGQTNIRSIITPVNQEIVRQDDTTATGWTSLPSPFYYVDKTENGYIIYGGGFGHGVGMSQNGANILAGEGHNYKYILRHYYSYIDFMSIYDVEEDGEEE